jgi:tetratricopeptide (TPR) repeat protein
MPSAKKIISAEIHLKSITQFNGNFQLQKTGDVNQQNNEILSFLKERYCHSDVGKIDFSLENEVAKFCWTLSRVMPDAEELHRQALELARKHNYKNAIENWIKAIAINPQDPDYYFNAGIAFYEEKNYQEAIENLEHTIKLCPIYFKARLILGTVYLKLRKFANAEVQLKESIYFSPSNPLAILNLGAVYSILKKYEEGINAFRRIIEISPKEPRAFFGLGKIYSIQGKTQKANECFRKVIEFDTKGELAIHAKRAIVSEQSSTSIFIKPNNELAEIDDKHLEDYYAEGYNAYLFGDYARSGDIYRKYIEYKSKDDNVWFSLGESYLRAGYPKEATSAFKNAIKIRKKGLYFKQLAIAYDFLSLTENAIDSIEQAIALGKKDSIVYTIWAKNLIKLNHLEDAIEKLNLALKQNKSNLSAIYHLAVAHTKNSQVNEAINYLHMILSSKIKSPIKNEAEELYSKLSSRK